MVLLLAKKNKMTTEEFLNKCAEEDIRERFDEILDFFSKELPAGFLEECDAGEVILEIKDHHVSARKFDRVLKFFNLIREKHPGLYHENFHYLDGFLVDLNCISVFIRSNLRSISWTCRVILLMITGPKW